MGELLRGTRTGVSAPGYIRPRAVDGSLSPVRWTSNPGVNIYRQTFGISSWPASHSFSHLAVRDDRASRGEGWCPGWDW